MARDLPLFTGSWEEGAFDVAGGFGVVATGKRRTAGTWEAKQVNRNALSFEFGRLLGLADLAYVGASSKKGTLGTLSGNSCFDGFRQYQIQTIPCQNFNVILAH